MDLQWKCKFCHKYFSNKANLQRHLRKIHSCDESTKVVYTKTCPVCKIEVISFEDYKDHVSEAHDINLAFDCLEFSSKQAFFDWKKSVEEKDNSSYVKHRADKTFADKSIYSRFQCHRSGYYKTRLTEDRRKRGLKAQGSSKINGYCPSVLKVLFDIDGSVGVSFCPTHVGHTQELAHLKLTYDDRKEVATKIASKVPFNTIVQDVRSDLNESLKRKHLLTKHDLYNIEKQFFLDAEVDRNSDDLSLSAWVAKEEVTESNSVLMYKPQGIAMTNNPSFHKEDFALGIMTPAQSDILLKYGSDCICIDSTQGMNAYGFQLTTIMVLDDLKQGFPCALFISNRSDTMAVEQFFTLIRNKVGVVAPNVLMSDVDDTFYNAWTNIMGQIKSRQYCTWHVDREWRKQLNRIKNPDLQKETYKKIRTLLEESEKRTFETMLPSTVSQLLNDPSTKDFGEYFENNYTPVSSYWAHCYHLNTGFITNMHFERMHKTIKHLYLSGKKIKSLDKAVFAIMQMIKDKLIDRLTVLDKRNISTKLKDLHIRHKNSLKMDTEKVVQTTETSWLVGSNSNAHIYNVNLVTPNCDCSIVCNYCQTCLHKYTCTCIDGSIKWNMCKHIHLVCQAISNQSEPITENNKTCIETDIECCLNIDSDNENYVILEEIIETNSTEEPCLSEMKHKLIEEFSTIVNNANNMEDLNLIKKRLKSLQSIIKARMKKTLPNPLEEHNCSPNQNISPQIKYKVVKKAKQSRGFSRSSKLKARKSAFSALVVQDSTGDEPTVLLEHPAETSSDYNLTFIICSDGQEMEIS